MFDTLVIGGAASGKSALAEDLLRATGGDLVYLATGEARDAEMVAKRDRHRAQRGPDWHTIEAPLDAADRMAALPETAHVLLDCATMWLTNHLLADHDLPHEEDRLIAALTGTAARVTVVTNELGQGIVPADALTRRFREAQGRLNIRLAAAAARVVLVSAGLPLWLKGAP